jgi:hypothetical protein
MHGVALKYQGTAHTRGHLFLTLWLFLFTFTIANIVELPYTLS